MKRQKVVLDCDTKNEIDDQFAIAYALESPRVELLGVVSVQNCGAHGAGSVDLYHQEARRILRLAGSPLSAYKGCALPLDRTATPVPNRGVSFLIECARRYGSKVTLVGTGPATNLATACLLAPQEMQRTRIVWIGGFRDNNEMRESKGKECNFMNDKRAVALVCSLDLDLTIVPAWGVSDRMILQTRFLAEKLKEHGTALSRYLASLLDSVPERHRILWDIAAVAVAEGFGVETIVEKPACIVSQGRLYYPESAPRTVKVVDSIDEFAILGEARRRLLK